MKNFKELRKAIKQGKQLIWNDPDKIDGNDYTITNIQDLTGINDLDYPISIEYGECSEAEVYINEISTI